MNINEENKKSDKNHGKNIEYTCSYKITCSRAVSKSRILKEVLNKCHDNVYNHAEV